jgi:hypothetical protein
MKTTTETKPTLQDLIDARARRLGYTEGADVAPLCAKILHEIECTKIWLQHQTDPAERDRAQGDIESLYRDRDELLRLANDNAADRNAKLSADLYRTHNQLEMALYRARDNSGGGVQKEILIHHLFTTSVRRTIEFVEAEVLRPGEAPILQTLTDNQMKLFLCMFARSPRRVRRQTSSHRDEYGYFVENDHAPNTPTHDIVERPLNQKDVALLMGYKSAGTITKMQNDLLREKPQLRRLLEACRLIVADKKKETRFVRPEQSESGNTEWAEASKPDPMREVKRRSSYVQPATMKEAEEARRGWRCRHDLGATEGEKSAGTTNGRSTMNDRPRP